MQDAIGRISEIAASVGVVAADRARGITTRDVRRPIDAALDLCASELMDRARVDVRVSELPPVRGNEGELCQVFSNLLINAAQSMDPARASWNRLLVDGAREDDFVCVRVTDTGSGIPNAHLARIFDPFFTTKAPGHGTGLGLFVSRRIVESCGGQLDLLSEEGKGTTVVVRLPLARKPHSPSAPLPAAAQSGRLPILIVDDEKTFLRSLELLLQHGHDVVSAHRATDALVLLEADPRAFDAVLCDLSMPDLDGVALYERAQTLGIAERFVIMTAGAFTPRSSAFVLRSPCRRIAKPFTFEQLTAVLDAVVAQRR